MRARIISSLIALFLLQAVGSAQYTNTMMRQLAQSSHRTPLIISEIMYNPGVVAVTNSLTYVEIFNTEPVPQNIGGWMLAGDVTYTFPPGTVLPARTFAVVAADPPAAAAFYGLTNVYGPMQGRLPNDGGTVRMHNREGAEFLAVEYDDDLPWPVAADGSGHSLVLAMPDYGEGSPQAWRASRLIRGSPGTVDPVTNVPLDAVVINEFLAHTDLPEIDYIELYNAYTQSVNIGGCTLSDVLETNKFEIPAGTILPPQGYVVFTQTNLGFSLSSHGDEIVFGSANHTRVIDAVRFPAQRNGVSMGRYPDGADAFAVLGAKTPGASNNAAGLHREDVVINEIMYHPISGNNDDEYVELHNTGTNVVDVGFWRLLEGITYILPPGTTIPVGGYLVVARNRDNLLAHYPQLNAGNTVGNYGGQLSDSGERLVLACPANPLLPDVDFVTIDELNYVDGDDWGKWSDGGGSSLELVDPRSDNRLPMNWAGSDEITKAAWTTVDYTGMLDNGVGAADDLRVYMLQAGECLMDNVKVQIPGGTVYMNETFESGSSAWVKYGDHSRSSDATEGYNSAKSLHIRASDAGNQGYWNHPTWFESYWNRLNAPLTAAMPTGTNVNIQARFRWLAGWPCLAMVVHGFWAEAAVQLDVPENLGTPGLANSRHRNNNGPAISEAWHRPVLPVAGQTAVVSARVDDPDGVSDVKLSYRVEPNTNYTTVAMNDSGTGGDTLAGDGRYSASIPGQIAGARVAFRMQAVDTGLNPQTNAFPRPAPVNAPPMECLVGFGQALPPGILSTYTMWLTDRSITRWQQICGDKSRFSNEPIDLTVTIGNDRVIYNAGGRYRGNLRGYQSDTIYANPVTDGSYSIELPKTESFMGESGITIDQAGQYGADGTFQVENYCYYIAREIGLPSSHNHFIRLFVNRTDRGILQDLHSPGRDFCQSWYGDDDPNVFKMEGWIGEPLNEYRDGFGKFKQARYRWHLEHHPTTVPNDDYSPVFAIVSAAAVTNDAVYVARLTALLNLRHWIGYFAVNGAISAADTYGWANAHNGYFYLPHNRGGSMIINDFDYAMDGTQSLFPTANFPVPYRMMTYPAFRRVNLGLFKELANGPMMATPANALIDTWNASFISSGTSVDSPAAYKTRIAGYRSSILSLLAANNAPFITTTGGGVSFNTTNAIVTLAGTAPVEVERIWINGIPNALTYPTVTNWSLRIGLPQGTNALLLSARDWRGNPVATNAITVIVTQPAPSPVNQIVISEIMYHPPIADDEYVELYNRSTQHAFDLRGWRLNGADLIFNGGSIIGPGQFAVVARSPAAYQHTYGNAELLIGNFAGNLDDGGETLSLQMPAGSSNVWTTIDQVTYDDNLPWSTEADGNGQALQLIDLNQDNATPANWSIISTHVTPSWKFKSISGTVSNGSPFFLGQARMNMYLHGPGTVLVDRVMIVTGTVAEAGANLISNGDFETALSGPWACVGNHANSFITTNDVQSGVGTLALVATGPGSATVVTNLLRQPHSLVGLGLKPVTLSYWYREILGLEDLTIEMTHTSAGATHSLAPPSPATASIVTPGATNSVAAVLPRLPRLRINEVMPSNITAWADNFAEFEPWVEIYNADTVDVSLANIRLGREYANPGAWAFPSSATLAVGDRLLVWADAETNQSDASNVHADFVLSPDAGTVILALAVANQVVILDALDYSLVGQDFSFGSYPEGDPHSRQIFHTPTPGSPNTPVSQPIQVVINEWMADNETTLRDPSDLNHDDWFELYNPSAQPVNLGGYHLTDNLAQTNQFTIPGGAILSAGAFLLVWADDGATLNGPGMDLHTNFRLSNNGEAIGLYRPDGEIMDAIEFGPQGADRGEGRWPNASPSRFVMAPPTPGASNEVLLVTSLPAAAPSAFKVSWQAQYGHVYSIYGVTNLLATNWLVLGLVTADSPTITFTDTNSSPFPERFYRIQLVE